MTPFLSIYIISCLAFILRRKISFLPIQLMQPKESKDRKNVKNVDSQRNQEYFVLFPSPYICSDVLCHIYQ